MVASLSQSISAFALPNPELSDPESVRSSLTLAHTEFERGELREALKHLRRAAEAADDAGSDVRSLALARAAADLATEVGPALTPAPMTVTGSGAPTSVAPAPTSVAPPLTSVAPPLTSVAPMSVVRGTADAAIKQLLDAGRAVKVAVKRSARDEELYVVRLASSRTAGLGTRQAVLVLLEPDDGFFSPTETEP